MSATIELRFKAVLDEFTFYRSQLQQTYLLAFEGSILAFMSPSLLADISSHFPNHIPPPHVPPMVGFFAMMMGTAWILLIIQAWLLLWPGKPMIDLPMRLSEILTSEMNRYQISAFLEDTDDKIADIARLRLIGEIELQLLELSERRKLRWIVSLVTLAAIIATFVATIAADVVLNKAGLHPIP